MMSMWLRRNSEVWLHFLLPDDIVMFLRLCRRLRSSLIGHPSRPMRSPKCLKWKSSHIVRRILLIKCQSWWFVGFRCLLLKVRVYPRCRSCTCGNRSSSAKLRMDVDSCYLDGNADAVEFCPHHPFHHILAVATYTLEEGNPPHRSGSISLFSADANVGLELLHRAPTTGIFDIKWNPSGDTMHPLLAQADADGCVSLLSLQSKSDAEDHGTALREVHTEKISSAMCLCVDWNTSVGSISLGLSDGSASIVTVRESQLQLSQSWAAHEYELWATTFDACRPHLLYTGADDCHFSCWDLRESPSNLVFQNSKSHKMGVCCIAQNPMNSNMLLTGSYDESLRLWDIRSTSKPVIEKSLCLGGGVWRIKHHPYISNLVLAACMHNGFAVVRIEEVDAIVVETYRKHESLAYGADWQRGVSLEDGSDRGSLVATCSFYDQLLRLWKPESVMVK